jgi:DNA-binding NarL/FixJ family response regulator
MVEGLMPLAALPVGVRAAAARRVIRQEPDLEPEQRLSLLACALWSPGAVPEAWLVEAKGSRVSESTKAVADLHAAGLSERAIGEHLGIPRSAVTWHLQHAGRHGER